MRADRRFRDPPVSRFRGSEQGRCGRRRPCSGRAGVSALWISREMEAATLGRATHGFEVHDISIDTRTLKPGDLFVALKGENRDGHQFVSAALDRGAAAALVSNRPDGAGKDAPLLLVANTQRALEDIGRAARA